MRHTRAVLATVPESRVSPNAGYATYRVPDRHQGGCSFEGSARVEAACERAAGGSVDRLAAEEGQLGQGEWGLPSGERGQ